MKIFLIICLASGLASSEKLDRSYLPPPGSKFSGGSPGDIETPLEFPKQPSGSLLGNGKPEIELGINRRPAPPMETPDSLKPGFSYFQKSYPVPTTTTSYAITQTTTFAPDEEYTGINQPSGFLNRTMFQSGFPGQNQPIRRPGQGQYRPEQNQTPYGTTARPQFPGVFNGPEYLPPVSNEQSPAQVISNQDDSGYPSRFPQGPQYQDRPAISTNQPGYVPQQNQYVGNPNIPSTASPQYQGERFAPTGPGSQQSQNQFPGSQFPSSTAAPQYQDGQRFITPGSNQQNLFTGSQLPSSTAGPQYQDGQRLLKPGSYQQDQFSSNQDFPSSTSAPQAQFGQRFTTPEINQVFGARVPNDEKKFTGYQYFPSSTAAPTRGSIEQNQFLGNQNFPSTAAPSYQDGQHFTTPGQIQGALVPGQPGFGSRVLTQNQFAGQKFPTSTSAPQLQIGTGLTTPGYVQEGYGSPVFTQQSQNQYPGNPNFPSSTTAPKYQNGQQFTPGLIGNQNFPSTAAPDYQGERFTTPGQFPDQQRIGSHIPGQQSQLNQNYLSSTAGPQYQDGQRFSTPGLQDNFGSPQLNQQKQYPVNQIFPSSTAAPQYQDGQRFSTPGSGHTFGTPQQNQYGNQNIPSSTAAPQYQGQRITTPGELLNQPTYSGSTTAPQYQQTLAPPGTKQQGVIPNQQNQFQRPAFNQQFPLLAPKLIPGSQPQFGNNNIPAPGTEGAFPGAHGGLPVSQSYGNNQQENSQTGVGSPVFGAGGNIGEGIPERPQAEGDRNAEILSYDNILTPEGYFYSYDTSNGIHADETGTVGNGTRAQGGFSYTGDDGKVYNVVYTADENGFRPRGDHLPTPPPIPDAIQRVIDQANKDKEDGIDDDGSYNEEKYGYMKYEGPFTRLRPHNRTVSVVNGADIPEKTGNRVGGQTKKTSKTEERKPVTSIEKSEIFESDYEETDGNESETDEVDVNDENRRVDDNLDKNKETNRRISPKRPKPIKKLNVEDNRSDILNGKNMPIKPSTNSKTGSIVTKVSNPSEQTEENVPDDEDSDDDDYLQESQGLDYDSDLVNYRDDPNNRTDFHGLNKYLPEYKKGNKKNKPARKRPTIRINGKKQSIEVNGAEKPEDQPDFVDETHTRIPSRKNKIAQRVKDQSKVTGQAVRDSDDETDSYGDDRTDTDEEYGSDDANKSVTNYRVSKPGTSKLNKKISGNPKRPNVNERTDMSNNKGIKSSQDNGYEYTPPQRKFGSEDDIKFPSRVNQKGAQSTLRPFMTKNVYGDENESADDSDGEYAAEKPSRGRPMSGKKNYPGYNQDSDSYDNPEVNKDIRFSTTRRPVSYGTSRPFGRPQTTGDSFNQNNPEVNEDVGFSTTRRPVLYRTSRPFGRPQTTGNSYNQNNPEENENVGFSTTRRPVSHGTSRPVGRPQSGAPQYQDQDMSGQVYDGPTIQTQRPGDKLFYNTNAPTRGTPGIVFSSTTPLPPSGPGSKHQRPGHDGSYFDSTAPDGETYVANTPSAQVPSTTYRPNYSFGDKTISPVTVDGFGRPIQSTNSPAFDRTLRPTYSTVRPSQENLPSSMTFKPTEGRFGVTSTQGTPGYQSTSAPIGEDFSGPKQPQRFDPITGYHY